MILNIVKSFDILILSTSQKHIRTSIIYKMDGRPDQTLLLQDQPMKKIIGKLIFIGGTRREGSLC